MLRAFSCRLLFIFMLQLRVLINYYHDHYDKCLLILDCCSLHRQKYVATYITGHFLVKVMSVRCTAVLHYLVFIDGSSLELFFFTDLHLSLRKFGIKT